LPGEFFVLRSPAAAIKAISVPETDKVFLNSEEIQRLANTPLGGASGADVRRAFLFGCFSGLRVSYLKSLAWGDIEHNPPQIVKRRMMHAALDSDFLYEALFSG
jgi:integrase